MSFGKFIVENGVSVYLPPQSNSSSIIVKSELRFKTSLDKKTKDNFLQID
jgi:hypothetical protein